MPKYQAIYRVKVLEKILNFTLGTICIMEKSEDLLLNRITSLPEILNGKPTIRGIRFLVSDVLEMLASGMKDEEILEQHPVLQQEDIQASLLYASLKMRNTVVIHAA